MNINLMAPINQLGYGVAGLNILKSLQKAGHDVALHVIGGAQITNKDDEESVKRALKVATVFDKKAPCIKVWHQHDMATFVGKGKHIGFPIFELDTFSEIERHHLQSCDRLFVCSEWAKDIVKKNIDEYHSCHYNINVVPLGVDMNIFKPAAISNNDKVVFFNCGKWEIRKGHDILIEAFKNVAKIHQNVELWMMCSNPFNTAEENARWHQLYNHPKVKLIPRAETQSQVYNIMSQVDCGIFPSRAEGWNLELLEMMACGKYVIATNYSAHTEFCNEKNCGLIGIMELESAFDGKWFFGQGKWAKIEKQQIEELTTIMLNFVEFKSDCMRSESGECPINKEGITTAQKFSWENTAKHITSYI
jgi:glycosyltransferase involved in cell wall biosynthesis